MIAPHVAVVVLSWNGREDTLACLRSLGDVEYEPLSLVVVDNGSHDGTCEAVQELFPGAHLVRNESNLGFAEGNNIGIRRALGLGAEHVVILNNDTEVDRDFVSSLVAEARRAPDAGALCSKLFYAQSRDTVWFSGASFDPRRGYNGRQRGYRQRDVGGDTCVTETDRACAAAMLVPRSVIERVGFFDPDLFAYSEDTDWSLRAKAAGYRLLVVPESRVWHRVSASSGGEGSPAPLYYGLRNTLEVCERHAPLGPFGTWRRRLVLLAAHVVQASLSPRRLEGLRAVLDGWRDFRRRRFGARPDP